jgi:outer membrane immunogenic protein
MFKQLIGAVGIVAAAMTAASAADLRMPVKAPPAAVAVYNWTGFYIGGNIGYSWGNASTDGTVSGSQNVSTFRTAGQNLTSSTTTAIGPLGFDIGRANVNGVIGGGQIGYNWQLSSWVLGLEADIQGSGERGSSTGCSAAGCPAGSAFLSIDQRLQWFGTVRGRVGILPTERVLLYATGGLAYGQLDTTFTAGLNGTGNAAAVGSSSTRAGWTVGAGVEAAIDPHWSIKLEYLYVDLGRFGNGGASGSFATNQLNTPSTGFNTVTTTNFNGAISTRFTDQLLRAGVNYHF